MKGSHSKLTSRRVWKEKGESARGIILDRGIIDWCAASVGSKSIETMKSHPNPLLTAVAPPINPALLKAQPVKPVVDNAEPPKPAETKATDAVVSSSRSSPAAPALRKQLLEQLNSQLKTFRTLKLMSLWLLRKLKPKWRKPGSV